MRIVIVGGGKVGGHLARQLKKTGHGIVLIEENTARALRVAEEARVLCLHGDGTDVDMLRRAETDRADYLLAVTGQDEDNLVACQLARTAFGTPRVLARLNDPRNRGTFDALDVPVVGFTDVMTKVIARELDLGELVRVELLDRGEVSLLDVTIPDDVPDRTVSQIPLPRPTVLVAIRRDGTVLVPGVDTIVQAKDRVLAVSPADFETRVRDVLVSGAQQPEPSEPESSSATPEPEERTIGATIEDPNGDE